MSPSFTCTPCPEGGRCLGGSIIIPLAGYWASSGTDLDVYKCPAKSYCKGGGNSTCAEGHTATICAICQDGWTHSSGKCMDCAGKTGSPLLWIVFIIIIVICCIAIYCCWRQAKARKDELYKVSPEEGPAVPLDQLGSMDHGMGSVEEAGELDPEATDFTSGNLQNAALAGLDPRLQKVAKLAKKMYGDFMGLFKILYGFLQVVSTLGVTLPSVPWPDALENIWEALSVVNLDALNMFSVDCISAEYTFYNKFSMTVSYPLVVLGSIIAITVCRSARQPADVNPEQHRAKCISEGWKVALIGSFIIYPSVSATVLKLFHCRNVEGTWYLTSDYRILCYDLQWSGYAAVGFLAIFIYCLGIPAVYFALLWTNRAALHNRKHPQHETVKDRLGFIYIAYEEEAWWWELVMLAQKLLLTGLLIFIKPDTITQLAAGFLISFTFFCVHVRVNAYVKDTEDRLQYYAMISISLTLFGGILYKTDTDDEDPYGSALMSVMIVGVNLMVQFLFMYQIIYRCRVRHPPKETNSHDKALETGADKALETGVDKIPETGVGPAGKTEVEELSPMPQKGLYAEVQRLQEELEAAKELLRARGITA